MAVISRIEWAGGMGWVVGASGWVGRHRQAKANIQTQMAVLCHQ